jgi:hypothetical protein
MAKLDYKIATKYLSLQQSAKSRNLEFNLSLTSLKNIYRAKRCYFSGVILTSSTVTIDRVDNTKGYVKGNIVACHKRVNQRKNNLTINEIELLYKGIQRHLNKQKGKSNETSTSTSK